MITKNLLVELLVEELPPKALQKLGESFATVLARELSKEGLLESGSVTTPYASPRRLAAHLTKVREKAPTKRVRKKLMPVSVAFDAEGHPSASLKKKIENENWSIGNLVREMDGGKEYAFIDFEEDGWSLLGNLHMALQFALKELPIPKVMGYQLQNGWTTVNFVRPAHKLVALHGSDVVEIEALGLNAGRETQGHRFEASSQTLEIRDADSYAHQLEKEGAVIASFTARRDEIVKQITAAAAKEKLTPVGDDDLLNEVTALVERPNVLLGQFEKEFLDVPPECLILTMKANQKYFPLINSAGKLTNKFLIVSNITPADPSAVIQGNERVVRPRLADAKFFFDKDRKSTLASRVVDLDKMVYHNKLGSQGERVQRVRAIAKAIALQLGDDALAAQADQAAMLAKADLTTDMVGEFPELQGIMGRYYAQAEGIDDEVAYAIEDHYKPRFAGDELPRNMVGICVALADKLETLVGMFGIGQIPTGDKDPFALRRHALGVIRVTAEQKLPLSLEFLLKTAIRNFSQGMLQIEFAKDEFMVEPLWIKIRFFLLERAVGYIRDKGYSAQEADAVVNIANPAEYLLRLEAIRKAQTMFPAEFAALANANKRAGNILTKSGADSEGLLADEKLCEDKAEKDLLTKTRELRVQVDNLANSGNFEAALLLTIQISYAVTVFFDSVMVNSERKELRLNRFRLLDEVTELTNRVADISKLAA